jgi:hypothetical protein
MSEVIPLIAGATGSLSQSFQKHLDDFLGKLSSVVVQKMAILGTALILRKIITQHFTKMAVFWIVAPCSLVEVYQRFRGPCCFQHRHDDGGSKDRGNVGKLLPDYNPEDSHLHTHCHENLKSYTALH